MSEKKKISFSDILENLPSLFYEFKDNIKTYTEKSSKLQYPQSISPLFDKDVIDDSSNSLLLSLIMSKIPYYYIEPSSMIKDVNGQPEEYILQDTRDCGINNVPSPLQTSSFWQTWFQNTWGFVYNALILNIYNKLQYPYINENLFLNNNLYTKLVESSFNNSSSAGSYIGFVDTEEENNTVYQKDYEFYGQEIGCLDTLQDIVSQKIDSEYFLIDYKYTSTPLLNKWGESLYTSGQMNKEELDSAKLLYKLQDIRNELFRRKLAGSKTLYSMIVESIDRKGSFISTIKESDIKQSSSNSYNSKRLFKALALPGITTQFVDYNSSSVAYGSLLNTFNLKSNDIPINTLLPIFYSSSTLGYSGIGNSLTEYDSDKFYEFSLGETFALDTISNTNESYRTNFLRDNVNLIDWCNLKDINLSESIIETYSTMDKYNITNNAIVYKDEMDTYDTEEKAYVPMDISSTKINKTEYTGSVLDISADRVLYHKNTIQDSLGSNYPYVTYPIADGNGLCLMDTYWLDYIEREIKYKSKVQDKTEVGVQLSAIKQTYADRIVIDYDFFAISYTNENYKESNKSISEIKIRDYQEGDRFVLLWYCTLSYKDNHDNSNKTTEKFTKRLISVITLSENFDKNKLQKFSDSDYSYYKSGNIGILPLTYNKAVDDTVWKAYSGFYESSEEEYSFVDDLSDCNYSTAMYVFTDYANLSSSILTGQNPLLENATIYSSKLCTKLPSNNTKAVFFISKRLNESKEYTYYWSDSIRVISLANFLKDYDSSTYDTLNNDVIYEYDNKDIAFYLNPYLNFNEECASPLRHSQVLKNSCLGKDSLLVEESLSDTTTGCTKNSLLSSLIADKEKSWLCNNLGLSTVKSDSGEYGYYLQKTNLYTEGASAEDYTFSYSHIQGDNRPVEEKVYTKKMQGTEEYITYSTNTDTSNIDCIAISPYFIQNIEKSIASQDIKGKLQVLDIQPYKDIEDGENISWDFKTSKNKSIFFEFSFTNLIDAIILTNSEIATFKENATKILTVATDINTPFVDSENTLYMYDPVTNTIKEHSMYLFSYGNTSLFISSKGEVTLSIGEELLTCSNSKINWTTMSSSGTYRLGFSIKENAEGNKTVCLCINNDYTEFLVSSDAYNSFISNSITLFRKKGNLEDAITSLFYGNIYSVRLYNRAMQNSSQMLLTNLGTFREVYSLSPSNYKLAYSVYKDLTIIKETTAFFANATSAFPEITDIRLLNRGVWDSILLDMEAKATSVDEVYDPKDDTDVYTVEGNSDDKKYYLNGCVEQELLTVGDYTEYIKGTTPLYLNKGSRDAVKIVYRDYDSPVEITATSKLAILNTLIEPMSYSEEPLDSGELINFKFIEGSSNLLTQVVSLNTENLNNYIRIPKTIDSSDDSFTYSTDINFNFKVTPSLDMSMWLSKGNNIDLQCVVKNNIPYTLAVLQDTNVFSATKNNIVLPLVIPYQDDNKDFYLDRFYFKNTALNSSLVSFLDATNYYTEVRFPILVSHEEPVYSVVKGMILTETSDVFPQSGKTYYTISDYSPAIQPIYTPVKNGFVYQMVGSEKDLSSDIVVTRMERGATYYILEGSNTSSTFSFDDGYSINSLYFVLEEDSVGNKTYVPYNEEFFDINTPYYRKGILNVFDGTEFLKDAIYYEDIIVSNTYWTYSEENNSYSLYNAGGNFSTLGTGVTFYTKDISSVMEYINKWDALRTLKTGTYYFTCKYPMQIIPFMDDVFEGESDHMYTTYYASSRFKIVVTREEYIMNSSEYAIKGTPSTYRANSLVSTIKSSSNRFSPEDNRTFPHMKVNIDLFVLDCIGTAGKMLTSDEESYGFKWVLLASNHSEDTTVLTLNKEALSGTILINKEIPMFLEKSYTSSFFVSSSKKLSDGSIVDAPSSADDDIICPITIKSNYISDRVSEKIKSYSEEDMDKQVLIAGKSYKIVFEDTAKITEFTFDDNVYTPQDEVSTLEKTNYSRLVNLLETDFLNIKDYMYDSDGRSFNLLNNINILNKTSGFLVSKNTNGYYYWKEDALYTIDNTSDTFALGDPYSKASSHNYILYCKNNSSTIDSRSNINNSYTYPYMVTENSYGLVVPAYTSRLSALSSNLTQSEVDIDESSIMLSHYKEIKEKINMNISSLKTSASGLFNGFSIIEPNFVETTTSTKTEISIQNNEYPLYGYYSNRRLLPLGNNNITITRKSLYGNNLLKNSSFDNTNYWTINDNAVNLNIGTYYAYVPYVEGTSYKWVSDVTWQNSYNSFGKDVFEVFNKVNSYNDYSEKSKATITLSYNGGEIGLNSMFETAINIRNVYNEVTEVQSLLYYNGTLVKTIDLTPTRTSGEWWNWSGSTEEYCSCDSITYKIKFLYNSGCCDITKAVVRKCNVLRHKLGFSDALNEVELNNRSSYVGINGHSVVLFKYPDTKNSSNNSRVYPDEYFPLQFTNTLYNTTTVGGKTIYRPRSGTYRIGEFISTNKKVSNISSESRIIELLNPFIRRLHVSKDGKDLKISIHKYGMYENFLNIYTKEEIYSSTFDIITQMNPEDIEITESNDKKYFLLRFKKLPLALNENKEFTSLGVNLKIDETSPIVLTDEKFSVLYNSFMPALYRKGNKYSVSVSNIQLIRSDSNGKKIYYEIEFLPIVYSELKNHFSLNMMFYTY